MLDPRQPDAPPDGGPVSAHAGFGRGAPATPAGPRPCRRPRADPPPGARGCRRTRPRRRPRPTRRPPAETAPCPGGPHRTEPSAAEDHGGVRRSGSPSSVCRVHHLGLALRLRDSRALVSSSSSRAARPRVQRPAIERPGPSPASPGRRHPWTSSVLPGIQGDSARRAGRRAGLVRRSSRVGRLHDFEVETRRIPRVEGKWTSWGSTPVQRQAGSGLCLEVHARLSRSARPGSSDLRLWVYVPDAATSAAGSTARRHHVVSWSCSSAKTAHVVADANRAGRAAC